MKCTKTIALNVCAAVALFAAPLMGETTEVAQKVTSTTVRATEDGGVVGNVFAKNNGEAIPVAAKLTLTADGVVVDSALASQDGSFSFPNVEPGPYQIYGASEGFVGGQTVDVQPYASSDDSSTIRLNLQRSEAPSVVYDAPSVVYDAPSVVYDAPSVVYDAPANAFGGGGGGGLIGGGGLNTRRLLALGAVGGIVAIAVSDDDDDDDASPDN